MNRNTENTAFDWFEIGKAAYDQMHYAEAIQYLTRALEMEPALLRAYVYRALTYERRLVSDKPEADFAQVIRLSPNSAEALFTRAMTESDSQEEVVNGLTLAIQADPAFGEAYLQRAIYQAQRDRVAESLMDFEQALRLSPGNLHVLEERHLVYAQAGDYLSAILDLSHLMLRIGERSAGLCMQLALYFSHLDGRKLP